MEDEIGDGLCGILHRLWSININDDVHQDVRFMKPYTTDGTPIRKLFIGNISQRTSWKDLQKLFAEYGPVDGCYVKKNPGKSNYAFVTFCHKEDALKAAKAGHMKKIHLHNRDLRVVPADSWHQPDSIENLQKKQEKASMAEAEIKYDLNPDCLIHGLNDDCLVHIFSFLPIVDRVRSERVCRRWRVLTQYSWHSFKRIDLSNSTWGINSEIHPIEVDTPILRKVLLRCGRYLTHIDFSSFGKKLSKSTLTVIGHCCSNLQSVDVTGLDVSPAGVKALASSCEQLTEFSLGHCSSSCDPDLSTLFSKNKKLKSVKLSQNGSTGKCFLSLTGESLEELVVEKCPNISPCHFSKAIQSFTNLKTLIIDKCVSFNDQVVKAISTHGKNISTLNLCDYYPMISKEVMPQLASLENLEVLDISQNYLVQNDFLIAISVHCKLLKNVDITACDKVDDTGLASICSLPLIEHLTVSYIGNITDAVLVNMPRLKTLECRGCPLIGNKGLVTLLEESHNLWLIDLSGCNLISNELIDSAIESTKSRTNGVVCKMYVGGTKVTETKKVSPFLQVLNVDLCEYYKRPDFDHNQYNFFPDEMYDLYDMDDDYGFDNFNEEFEEDFEYDALYSMDFPDYDNMFEFYHANESDLDD
ncbi:putative RNA-binding protein EEED8.10 isoform X1 [Trichogramma pretiosum]|uniref:putative RNA-binding protein EEED8.10 isoform X1 n=1 Tax=Trichogramma pretiosum TaxID=7493 RepID=UPI0006C96DEA|nr:putative RNA-binding protein EEED8.10 isoform X1 [Trichogramma pretiosum]XP_023316092.1 putative RNA-binding protein EEED8.10 isoform X1 [Trichogramma pretiosum]XP_023316093.1 putative RNA-binding protein EEED8.10 isoform X1 [Trichogramma pretiosum]